VARESVHTNRVSLPRVGGAGFNQKPDQADRLFATARVSHKIRNDPMNRCDLTSLVGGGAILALLVAAAAPPALADPAGVDVGILSCHEASGWGFVFGSSRSVHCTFAKGKEHMERYTGHISKFGVDVGYQQAGVLVWTVFAPTSDLRRGALDGHYGGVTAGASVGVGAGANALIGGSNRTITLRRAVSYHASGRELDAAGRRAATPEHDRVRRHPSADP
jgi:hypothetical protein